MSAPAMQLRRRAPRGSPLSRLRLGRAERSKGSAPSTPYPGRTEAAVAATARARGASAVAALLLHGAALGLVALFVTRAVVPETPPIPVQILKEEPPPRPKPKIEAPKAEEPTPVARVEPVPAQQPKPAPAPKALAERRSVDFAPQAQAVAPNVLNPRVIANAAPTVQAERLRLDQTGSVVAPKEISRSAVSVEHVSPVSSIAAAQASKVDLGAVAAPALRGPTDPTLPGGASAGPRQITTAGSSVGTGTVANLSTGSSVREGIASNRDVVGSPDGARVASVNTRVGESLMHGTGGSDGAGGGGDGIECYRRPEAQAYIEQVKARMYARWVLPEGVPSSSVELQFSIDPGGSVSQVRAVGGGDPRLAQSAAEALRAASPFPPLPAAARCLAQSVLRGTFRNPTAGG
ncbi:MAG TPA: TonB C-terminal domain-containing protein [Myxococcota bacterium]|nr:TonB C-terminal domain-containing protein [Myxococcota bacterium]